MHTSSIKLMVISLIMFVSCIVCHAVNYEIWAAPGTEDDNAVMQLSKGPLLAVGHTDISTVVTFQGNNTDQVVVDSFVPLGNYPSYFMFTLTVKSTAAMGDYLVKFHDGKTDDAQLPATLTVHVVPVALIGVTFFNSDIPGEQLYSLEFSTYFGEDDGFEWYYTQSSTVPAYAAYPQDIGTIHVGVKIKGPKNTQILVKALPDALLGGVEPHLFTTDNVNGEDFADNLVVHNPLPEGVNARYVTWNWVYSLDDGATWTALVPTGAWIYTTYTDNSETSTTDKPFWQLYHIGCTAVAQNDYSSQPDVIEGIWQPFQNRAVNTVPPASDKGIPNYYYYKYPGEPGQLAGTTQSLLSLGHGRCGAFGRFFADLLAVQGISAEAKDIIPDPTDNRPPAVGTRERKKLVASQNGQGGEAQSRIFGDHVLVWLNEKIFDPSYGLPADSFEGYATLSNWEDGALAPTDTGFKYGTDNMFLTNWVEVLETELKPIQ